ncbi:MAG TPA: hypothetical protein VIX19_12785 [Terriglobales bacterium]
MNTQEVQIGQIWRSNQTRETWLVTKTYAELFTFFAVLRKIGGCDSDVRRVKVGRSSQGPVLAGFSRVDESA